MKVVHIYGTIINCEEIRDIEIKGTKYVHIHYRNPASPSDFTIIDCANEKDAKDVMDIIYDEMVA